MWFTVLVACGGAYDLEDWQSPLASQAEEAGDVTRGSDAFFDEHWEDTTAYALSCASCHHGESGDTLTVDSDDLNRPGHTVYNAAHRATWKISQDWDEDESTILGAFGGQVCVAAYFPDGSEMTAQQAADLEAYIKTLRDDPADPDDERAQVLDYGFKTWTTQDDVLASLMDDSGWTQEA